MMSHHASPVVATPFPGPKPREHRTPGARGSELSLTFRPLPGESTLALLSRMSVALRNTTLLHVVIFGCADTAHATMRAMQHLFGAIDWPITWVDGIACDGNSIAGIQATALATGTVDRIRLNGRVVASVFHDDAARHCLVGGIGPDDPSVPRFEQTRQTLENLHLALADAGFSIADTVRTWFFLDDILSWYGTFNRARTQVYSDIEFRTGSLPASTGVGARNPDGAALVLAARAMRPLTSAASAVEVASPLQCPAPNYGSSFSRAMEISSTHGRQLFISGTASIAPGGETLWQHEIDKQVDLTMNVVQAILDSRGFKFDHLSRAVAYFKRSTDIHAFTAWCAARGFVSLPVILTRCDICRPDLAFEFEADAVKRS